MPGGGAQRWLRIAALGLCGRLADATAATSEAEQPVLLRGLASEAEALSLLRKEQAAAEHCDPEEGGWLVNQGWFEAAKELVVASHRNPSAKRKSDLEAAVRREVTLLKQQADQLLLALAPKRSEQIGVVRCSFQWAQNSTTVFISGKFSHRWSSPGALKIYDEKSGVTPCCFNFSASGEHSQLHKRYALDLHFLHNVSSEHWSFELASAGRFTVILQKQEPGNWPRLLNSKDRVANMGSWDSMHAKWSDELREFDKKRREAKKAKRKGADEDEMAAEAAEEHAHEEGRAACPDDAASPFRRSSDVTRLCGDYWPPRMEGKQGRSATWVVLFYSPEQMGCRKHEEECNRVRKGWQAVAKKVPQVGTDAEVGAVNCDRHSDFCKKQEVGHMPFVRRYKRGKRKTYYGEWEIDSLMQFLLS